MFVKTHIVEGLLDLDITSSVVVAEIKRIIKSGENECLICTTQSYIFVLQFNTN
jgi:hypothetical protein